MEMLNTCIALSDSVSSNISSPIALELLQPGCMNECVKFGEFVRNTRLANAITGRDASQAAGLLPSNFSKLEHGVLRPPKDAEKQKTLASAIGIVGGSEDEALFFSLAAKANRAVPVDLAEIISREDAMPLLLRTIGSKRLGKAEIERLIEIVRGTGTAGAAQKLSFQKFQNAKRMELAIK